jgi:hypothetical protein
MPHGSMGRRESVAKIGGRPLPSLFKSSGGVLNSQVTIMQFKSPPLIYLALMACGIALLATDFGCQGRDPEADTPAFVPSWDEARQALEASLSAWRERPASAPAPIETPGVQFVDSSSKSSRRLVSFRILGQTEVKYARHFTVKLEFSEAESPELVKYHVVGRDPVWVFRLDDFEKFAHWEHDMTAPEPGSREQANAASAAVGTK